MPAKTKSWNQGTSNHNWRHGFAPAGTQHPFYRIWCGIKARCSNPSSPSYRWYGSKGIKVCERWEEFKGFYEDMFPTWALGMEIDRIDFNGHYCHENCRWVTDSEQARNTSRNHWIEFNGQRRTITDWSKLIGGAHSLVRHRLRLGWPLEKILTTPPKLVNRKPRCSSNTTAVAPATGGQP